MDVIYVLAISVLLQFTAAFLALRLIQITGGRIAWILISAAISLMAIRRSFILYQLFSEYLVHPPDLTSELIALATSVLMVAGIASIAPIFHSIKRSEEALRKINRDLKVITMTNQVIIRATEEAALLKDVCRTIAEVGEYRFVWVGFAEQNEEKTVRLIAYAGHEEGYLDTVNITWADTERGRGPTGTAIRTGKPSVVKDILTDPDYAPWRDEAVKRGYASLISLPLIANNKTLGALNIYAMETDAFDIEEVNLLTELANDMAFGIMSLHARIERKRAEEKLRESEKKYRTLLETLPQKIFHKDKNSVYVSCNENYARDLKIKPAEIAWKTDYDFFPEELAEKYRTDDKRIIESGEVEDIEEEYIQNGQKCFVHTVKTPVRDDKGNVIGILGIFWDITEKKKMEEEIKKRIKELEQFYEMAVGRELRMIELKKEIESLEEELGKYKK